MCVYSITNTVDGKRYIGSSVNFKQRKAKHLLLLGRGQHHSARLQNAWDLYGQDAFKFEILEAVDLKEFLTKHEQNWMDSYQSCGNHGYNVAPTAGSSLGRKSTLETRIKISKGNTGKIFSPETRAKISAAKRNYKYSEIAKTNMSLAAKARGAHSKEVYAKISATNTGKIRSDEARINISKSKLGKEFSDLHKKSLSKAWELRKLKFPLKYQQSHQTILWAFGVQHGN